VPYPTEPISADQTCLACAGVSHQTGTTISDSAHELSTSRLTPEPFRPCHAEVRGVLLVDTGSYHFTGDTPTEVELAERYRRQVAGPLDEEER